MPTTSATFLAFLLRPLTVVMRQTGPVVRAINQSFCLRCLCKLPNLALFTFLATWHASAVSLPPGDVIFTQVACPLNDVIFCLHRE